MIWSDQGYLLSKIRYNENSIISEFVTNRYGKVSGIIFGKTKKKIKNYLQIGNKLHLNYSSKNNGKIGFFKVEILEALTPLYFDNMKKLMCISSAINLIKILTAENQENQKIFRLINSLFKILNNDNWIKNYILWELEFLKVIGYDLALKNIVQKEIVNNKTLFFVESSKEKKIIPNFLIIDNNENLQNEELLRGLKLVSDYLDKTILKPNNINYPISRSDFVNILK